LIPTYQTFWWQAAGVAAALAARANAPVRDVDFDLVREQLLAQGAILERPPTVSA
jgi:hypothetical protein